MNILSIAANKVSIALIRVLKSSISLPIIKCAIAANAIKATMNIMRYCTIGSATWRSVDVNKDILLLKRRSFRNLIVDRNITIPSR